VDTSYTVAAWYLAKNKCNKINLQFATDINVKKLPLRFVSFFLQSLLQPILGPDLLFSSVITFHSRSRVISRSEGRYLNTGQHKHRMNAYTHQTSFPRMGFEPTIPASERAKTVRVLDRATTVTGLRKISQYFNPYYALFFVSVIKSIKRHYFTQQ
jgi:hypothetical protein